MSYFLLRGKILVGDKTGSKRLYEFHTPEFELEVKEERATHYNSGDAVKVKDLSVVAQMDVSGRMVLDEFDPIIVAMALGGEVTEQSSGPTFSAKAFPTGLVVGGIYPIPDGHVNLSSLTLVDSTGSPVTLTLNNHYSVDLVAGTIKILNLSAITQPLKASGAVANGANIVSIATKRGTEKFFRFDGINLADNDAPVIFEGYRGTVGTSKIMVKSDGNEVNKCEFAIDFLRDESAPFDSAFGKTGRMVKI